MNAKPLNLLVVEDDEAHVEAIRRAFDAAGGNAEIRVAGTLQEYRELVAAAAPDLALVDLNLPDGRAVEILTRPPADAPCPILVMTAFGNQQIVVEVMKAGALDYVVKSPEAFAAMPQTVARALREWRLLQQHKRAGQFLFESEEKHRRLIEHIPDVVWRLDSSRQAVFLSANALNVLGHPPEELYAATQRLWFDRIHPEDAERVRAAFAALFQTGTRYDAEYRLLQPEGTWRWLRDRATAVIQKEGIRYADGISSDITALKQAEVYHGIEREVLKILNMSGDRQDFIGRVLATLKRRTGLDAVGIRLQRGEDFPYFVQEGFTEGFLLTENSLVARTADGEVWRDKDGNACLECTCGLVLSGQTDPANPLFTKGGSCWTNDSPTLLSIPPGEDPRHHPRNQCVHHGYGSVALVPIRTQNRIIGLIQLNDRRKGCFTLETVEILEGVAWHIGEALVRLQTEKELGKALLRAEHASRAKSEFLTIMSHELRTPLSGVLGFAQLLAETPLDNEQKDYVRTINKSGEHLLAVVSDILDFSSIEAGTLAIHGAPLAVADLVKTVEDTVRKTAAEKGLELRCELAAGVPEQIAGDEQRIRQILSNLLGNAVKFTASGSVVLRVARSGQGAWASRPCEAQVSAAMPVSKRAGCPFSLEEECPPTASGESFLDFCVEDTGIGISSETLDSLFQPFVQADAKTNRRFGGAGLGLAITKRLAEAMGGSITVASTPGKGSTFTFRLPLESAPVRAATHP